MVEAAQSVTSIKPTAIYSYQMVKSGDWKTWHVRPNASTKRGGNKGGGYSGTYASETDCNKTAAR